MANNVFANDLEIACKAADGKSIAAFPDPCFTPPAPSAGWVLIPYANTAYAKDTTNASKTVFISGKPIMKKDISFFKTSTGNEPAAGPKGKSTGVKKGKAYFTSWSMNVKVEGQNVCRHTDGMTHNHGSKSGNTGVFRYMDSTYGTRDCKEEFKKIEKKCTDKTKKGSAKTDWKANECGLLKLKPSLGSQKKAKENLEDLKKTAENMTPEKLIKQMSDELTEVFSVGIGDVAWQATKKGLKRFIPFYGWYTIPGDLRDANKFFNLKNVYENKLKELKVDIPKYPEKIEEMISDIGKGKTAEASEKLASIQEDYGLINGCIRARKCALIPYNETAGCTNPSGNTNKNCPKGKKKKSALKAPKKQGCCTGQTGHHLMPDSYFTKKGKRGVADKDICKSYDPCQAPTVCVEGANHSHGSHGKMHDETDRIAKDKASTLGFVGKTFDYEDGRNAAIEAHQSVFPFSFCSKECLEEQLDNYYDCACDGWFEDDLNANTSVGYKSNRKSVPLRAVTKTGSKI